MRLRHRLVAVGRAELAHVHCRDADDRARLGLGVRALAVLDLPRVVGGQVELEHRAAAVGRLDHRHEAEHLESVQELVAVDVLHAGVARVGLVARGRVRRGVARGRVRLAVGVDRGALAAAGRRARRGPGARGGHGPGGRAAAPAVGAVAVAVGLGVAVGGARVAVVAVIAAARREADEGRREGEVEGGQGGVGDTRGAHGYSRFRCSSSNELGPKTDVEHCARITCCSSSRSI